MAERVLPDPLSGEEIRVAILDKLMERLSKDGYLNKAHAYAHYTAKVSIHIECVDIGTTYAVDVNETVTPVQGNPEDAALEAFDAQFEVPQSDPTEVRVGTGQEVPVLSHNSEGKPDIKHVKYSRKAVAKR